MPELFVHLKPIMEGFALLSSSRQATMGGVGPIPLGEIITWLNWSGVQGMDRQAKYIRLLRAMDNAYLKEVNKPPEGK
jgi:hypothetical protein